jgi:hypothetical protein
MHQAHLLRNPTGGRHAGWPHWFGLGLFGGGVKLITVLQLRHENVSNRALFSSDLPLSIASPQSGQCRMGGRD